MSGNYGNRNGLSEKSFFALLTAVVLAGCAGAVVRHDFPPAPLPVVQVGDIWRYRVFDSFTKEPRGVLEVKVAESRPDSIVALISEGENVSGVRRTFMPGWNPSSGRTPVGLPLEPFTLGIASGQTVEYTPAYPALRFPLEPGKRWTERILATDPETQKRVGIRVHARVVGTQQVKVPAGEFEAIKVRREIYYEDAEWWRSPVNAVEIDWYAPQARQVVRRYLGSQFWDYSSAGHDGGAELRLGDHLEVELESYSRATIGRR